jgi:hypothetical protein
MFTLFGAKCRIVKIYLEDIFDIFYHKGFVYISIAHTIHISLFFLLHCSNFIKICAKRSAQIMTYFFFFLLTINLNHNVILYLFITLLILYW